MAAYGRQRPSSLAVAPARTGLNLSLLGDLQRIVHFDSEIPDGALKFAMTEEKLNGAEISGPSVD